jgi:glycosyltransferase involved in cell wall biosynthesis
MKQDRPMRIMQIIARMNLGGPAVIVAELMQGLDSSSFKMQLVTGFCADDEADYLDEVAPNIPVTRIAGLGRSVSPLGDLKSFFVLLKLIRQYQPDVIHTHTAKAGVLGRLAGLIAYPSAKRIHTYHGHLLHGYFPAWKTHIVVSIEKLLARPSAALITIGTQVRKDLLAVGIGKPKQYSVIFPGLGRLNTQTKVSARKELNLEQDKMFIVFVGRLAQIKRPDRLIDIARDLKINHPGVEILMVGAGEKFTEIKELVEKEALPMVLFGWRNDIGRILSASDIAILCSDNEGIPLTLIQASQAGLPIISTNVGSVSDIVINDETGILTSPNSSSLILALNSMISDPEKLSWLGAAGKVRAQELFSVQAMIKAHEDLYSQ